MNYKTELKNIERRVEQASEAANNTEKELQAEIEKLRIQYKGKQESLEQQLIAEQNELHSYCLNVEKNSTFEIDFLGMALAELMSLYEGRSYCVQVASYHTEEVQNLVFDRMVEPVTRRVSVIVRTDKKQSSYSDNGRNSLPALVANGEMLVLQQNRYPRITIYREHNNGLSAQIRFGEFSYVKDFIDELVSYKMEHGIETIPAETLEQLRQQFLTSRIEEIKSNYLLREQEEAEQQRQQMETNRQNRQYQLKGILNQKGA